MPYDPLRVTLEAELSVVTDYRVEEISEHSVVLVTSSADSKSSSDQYGIPRSTHRCFTFRARGDTKPGLIHCIHC